jgi:glycosyltransferase involved in cell wall biosynthesis
MKNRIAFITNSYKAISEKWMWRQTEYLKDSIGYIGVMENTEPSSNNIPLENIFELPLYKNESLSSSAFKLAKSFYLLRRLDALEKKYDINIYYIHFLTNAFLLKEFVEASIKQFFVHCHGYDITWDLKNHQYYLPIHSKEYLDFASQLPSNIHLIANSQSTMQKLNDYDVKNSAKTLYFGAPVIGKNLTTSCSKIKILYLGRLVDFKGPDLTIQAFNKACNMGLDGELIIAGDGPLMVSCRLLQARSKYADKITILGSVTYEQGEKLRTECDVFTAHNMKGSISNQEEAFGVTIIEAMGAGLPVVTGSSGGIKETVVHNKTGFLFEPGDIGQHADYLLKLANDHKLRRKMSKAAINHVQQNFTLEQEKKKLIQILEL